MIPYFFHNYLDGCININKGVINGNIEDVKKEYIKCLFNVFEKIDKLILKYDKKQEQEILLLSKYFKSNKTMTSKQLSEHIGDILDYLQDTMDRDIIDNDFEFFYEDKWQKIDWNTDGVIDLINQYYQ